MSGVCLIHDTEDPLKHEHKESQVPACTVKFTY